MISSNCSPISNLSNTLVDFLPKGTIDNELPYGHELATPRIALRRIKAAIQIMERSEKS